MTGCDYGLAPALASEMRALLRDLGALDDLTPSDVEDGSRLAAYPDVAYVVYLAQAMEPGCKPGEAAGRPANSWWLCLSLGLKALRSMAHFVKMVWQDQGAVDHVA